MIFRSFMFKRPRGYLLAMASPILSAEQEHEEQMSGKEVMAKSW